MKYQSSSPSTQQQRIVKPLRKLFVVATVPRYEIETTVTATLLIIPQKTAITTETATD